MFLFFNFGPSFMVLLNVWTTHVPYRLLVHQYIVLTLHGLCVALFMSSIFASTTVFHCLFVEPRKSTMF
ncbi:hypothetical protein F5879DRAFT_942131 [Lentinula edodes]|nr:hypothetical protein F5879DRAFT_942131 [Lentinula edodes]